MKTVLVWAGLVVLLVAASPAQKPIAQDFHWNWRDVQRVGNQTVATSKDMSAAERTALLDALDAQFEGYPKPMVRAAQTSVRFVDLNADGIPEVISRPSGNDVCSPTGNCPLWVFQRVGAKYSLILEKGSAQSVTIRTNGYFDLVLGMHGSATEQELFVYEFRDGRYRRTACYDANWTYLGKDGEYHDLEEPRITPCNK